MSTFVVTHLDADGNVVDANSHGNERIALDAYGATNPEHVGGRVELTVIDGADVKLLRAKEVARIVHFRNCLCPTCAEDRALLSR